MYEKPFEEWYKAIVFDNGVLKRFRKDCINIVANKYGGAHFDLEVPIKYDTFSYSNLFTVSLGKTIIPFSKNPVYVSIRK